MSDTCKNLPKKRKIQIIVGFIAIVVAVVMIILPFSRSESKRDEKDPPTVGLNQTETIE